MLQLFWILATIYLLSMLALFVMQRNLLFHTGTQYSGLDRRPVSFDSEGLQLRGWILNPGQSQGLIYFGGNAEDISLNADFFEQVFSDYTIYLVNYRGYGESEGSPSEASLFADALAIYDQVQPAYRSISLLGRSLGSGVAVYLAAHRAVKRLILLTPYDSIAEVAQRHYPLFPTRYLVRDKFDSMRYAAQLSSEVLIVTAEFDRVVPLGHSLRLKQAISQARYQMIAGAAHNNITDFAEYRHLLTEFIVDSP